MILHDMFDRTGSLRAARFLLVFAVLARAIASWAQVAQPEAASGFAVRAAVAGKGFMAVTANPYATDAAAEILQLGGNALDAAIAAQWVLNLVEPQSSGIGGGGFMLHWDATRREVAAWDGRETAPRGASALPGETASHSFARRPDGSLAKYHEVLATGRAVGVPGLVAMLEAAHRRHGKLKWERLFRPAIRLAENGFAVSPRLHLLLRDDSLLRRDAAARALYYREDGQARQVGETLRNPDLAATLRGIAAAGADALHRGEAANRIATAVKQRGGALTAADIGDYRPKQRDAVCGLYRRWHICGMPPPSSGGIGVLQLMGLLERSDAATRDPAAPDHVHLFAEAGRLVYADRARYLADPDFVAVPQRAMLDPGYLEQRARLMDSRRSMGIAAPGKLPAGHAQADDDAPELPATTHVSIVDQTGNAVALTSSIESAFGSRIQVDGFLLNNQLTDFSLASEQDGRPVANRLEPGKRPLSSMAPTFVFDADGRLHAVLGSPGGGRIINYVARTLVALLDGGMDPAMAVSLPHVGNRNGATEIERGRVPETLAQELERRGHALQRSDMTSGLHLIVRVGDAWVGAVDPRREGTARGE
ncbi:gamma-glutamyltransferase 1 [Sulfuritalea hydrogenivorans sk43H]|uniref:Glutathione hydrolase proenzyme n=2 Tax=Sulfuritalea hydrogenivorans TaxID=748811 RepID=W0SCI0_9PROT|nr:gamma-glutamyltransferase 1 [Sulfuritalea hydrogenivorans sk43H]